MSIQLNVTAEQLACIVAALRVVSPTGGGSETFGLANTLPSALPHGASYPEFEAACEEKAGTYYRNVITEYGDSLEGSNPELHDLVRANIQSW